LYSLTNDDPDDGAVAEDGRDSEKDGRLKKIGYSLTYDNPADGAVAEDGRDS
jgi:hypothetical protein